MIDYRYTCLNVSIDGDEYETVEEIALDQFMDYISDPNSIINYSDEEISEALVIFNEAAQKLLIEAQRRGVLEEVMDNAMKLQGAPKGE